MKALLVVLPLLLACKERSAPEPPVRDEAAKPVPGDATRATLAEELERLRAEHDLPALAGGVARRRADRERGGRVAQDGHSGSNTMWYATTMVVLASEPQDRIALVMVTNSGSDAIEKAFARLFDRHVSK